MKLVYSQLNEAIRLAEVENDDISGWNFEQSSKDFFDQYIANHLKIVTKKSSESLAGDGIYFKKMSGENERDLWVGRSPVDIYTTMNGTDILCHKTSPSGSYSNLTAKELTIDINGINTKPNQWGKDLFLIYIGQLANKRLYFHGTYSANSFTFESEPNTDRDVLLGKKAVKNGSNTYACNKNSDMVGTWCGRLIQVDGWEIRKDYPW